jgi:hypothetical protein
MAHLYPGDHRIERRTQSDPIPKIETNTMPKYKLEYIWLDGKKPVPDLRGKSLLKSFDKPPTLADLPQLGL